MKDAIVMDGARRARAALPWRGAATLLLLLVTACSSGGTEAADGESPGNVGPSAGAAGSSASKCYKGASCTCSDGLKGSVSCLDDKPSCDCGTCAFHPGGPEAFFACGGEPFGTWRAVAENRGGAESDLYKGTTNGAQLAGTCAIDIPPEAPPTDLRLKLADGGKAWLSIHPISSYKELESCVQSKLGAGCSALQGVGSTGVSCVADACGICTCTSGTKLLSLAGTWSRTDSKITVQTDAGAFVADYCVEGSTMKLRLPWKATTTLSRSVTSGAPAPCSGRTAATCTVGGGCHLGACLGSATCTSASSQSDCTNKMGCTWSSDACGGSPPATCTLDQFGVVPGCDIGDGV